MTTEQREQPSAADLMRQRFAADGAERCGAPLHGDTTTPCLAEPHGADMVHVTEINDASLGVERQLIQWSDAPAELQASRNDHDGTQSG